MKSRWRKTESADGESSFLCRRLQEALLLSQALAHLEEMEAAEWQRLATEDLRQGGSLQVELSSPVFLAGEGPKAGRSLLVPQSPCVQAATGQWPSGSHKLVMWLLWKVAESGTQARPAHALLGTT